MFLLEISFDLRPESRREFNFAMDELLRNTGGSYTRATTYEDRDDGNHILLVLEWRNRSDLELYLNSRTYGVLLGCVKTLGTLSGCRIVDLTASDQPAASKNDPPWVCGVVLSDTRTRELT